MARPEILAPAGDTSSMLAAFAAGADAVYMGLKHFSARMQAENFSATDMSRAVELANQEGRRIYVAFNTLVKPNDIASAAGLLARLQGDYQPHALIVQEPGVVELARQVGYTGEIFLSTLANVTSPEGLLAAQRLGVDRVILPRELSIDEIKQMDEACPEGLKLEMFIHGALCWCVSGRCYWSSYMGGKSGLRGRCVQPCRRRYSQNKYNERYFSCLDLSLDVLTKTISDLPNLVSWKIEGRKKGPHYVYHVVAAYKMLRDHGQDAKARKDAEKILEMALGRPGTHALFLPQRKADVTSRDGQTSSGKLIGKVQRPPEGKPFFKPYIELLAKDYLRIGYEDEAWHSTLPVTKRTPKAGSFTLNVPRHKTPKVGTPVFLIDRREPELMRILNDWRKRLDACQGKSPKAVDPSFAMPTPIKGGKKYPNMWLRSSLPTGAETKRRRDGMVALWLSPRSTRVVSRTVAPHMAWWLPPVIWPNESALWARLVHEAVRLGGKTFVCNAPWQVPLFERVMNNVSLIAGPFCNIANAYTLQAVKNLGFAAAFVSPELTRQDFLSLPSKSPIPLGMVLSGYWPMGIARHEPFGIQHDAAFSSPKGESFWIRKYGQNSWIYPTWPLDLTEHHAELVSAGYSFFAHMKDDPPKGVEGRSRPGLFNWNEDLL